MLALADASVLVRLLVTSKDEELTSKISEYTNSQNPIKEIDLRSVDKIQLKIERRLEQEGIQYRRKRGGGKPISKNIIRRFQWRNWVKSYLPMKDAQRQQLIVKRLYLATTMKNI